MSRSKSATESRLDDDRGVAGTVTCEAVFEILSNRRRRYALHYLKRHTDDGEVSLRELAEHVAAWEYDKPVVELTADERKRVLTALRQFHLPKMDDSGFVEFDPIRGDVRLSESVADLDVYLDVVPGPDVPWGVYYLMLSGVGMGAVLAGGFDVFPFAAVPDLALAVGIVVAFGASAVVHAFVNYRQHRLGATETPPEVTDRDA